MGAEDRRMKATGRRAAGSGGGGGREAPERRDPQTYAIIGAAMDVHNTLGHGFLEAVYQQALALELHNRGIPFQREVTYKVRYKGVVLGSTYRADFVCYGDVIVELKAKEDLDAGDEAQLLNYLRVSGCRRGLLFNFGASRLQYKRMVLG